MQPFPPSEQLQAFVGDAIGQVLLDPFGVQFRFESERDLMAALRIEHREADGTLWAYDCEAAKGPPLVLHRLLYKRIVAVDREELSLTFRLEDGASLVIFTDLGPYEAGHIASPETGFAVF